MRILIIGDVHGRTFWKKDTDLMDTVDKVVFLGDYLDPYPHEGISKQEALDNFREILKFKYNNFDKVVLLIGNHDEHYWPEFKKQWGCRRDDKNFDEISNLFIKNQNCFQVSYKYDKYLFTHAGVLKDWLNTINNERPVGGMVYSEMMGCEPFKIDLNNLNSLLETEDGREALWMVSRERGGNWYYGGCLWADICEHDPFDFEFPGIYQIFGHTMTYPTIEEPFICNSFAMLDCQRCYILDTETGNFIENA